MAQIIYAWNKTGSQTAMLPSIAIRCHPYISLSLGTKCARSLGRIGLLMT